MSQDPLNLIWIDLEMTGLDTNKDYIIEIATIVTDSALNILEEGPVIAIHQDDAILEGMDDWNKNQHSKSGLLNRVQASPYTTEVQAEQMTLGVPGQACRPPHFFRCAATVFAKTAVFSPVACRSWSVIFITAIWM